MADERDAVRLKADPTYKAIEREIAQALAVEPSPEFLARVRMRVTSEPPPRRAWWMPVLAGATAIAAALVIVIVAPWRGSQVRLKPDTTTPPSQVQLKPDTTAGPDEVRLKPDSTTDLDAERAASAFRRTKASQALPVRLEPDITSEPEVLISRSESAAFRRLIATAREGREDLSVLLKRAPAQEDSPEIDIPIIKVEPLVPQTNGEGVPQ